MREAQLVIIGVVDSMNSLPDISSCVDEGPDTQTIHFIDGKTTFRSVGRFLLLFLSLTVSVVCVCVRLYYTFYHLLGRFFLFLLFFFFFLSFCIHPFGHLQFVCTFCDSKRCCQLSVSFLRMQFLVFPPISCTHPPNGICKMPFYRWCLFCISFHLNLLTVLNLVF